MIPAAHFATELESLGGLQALLRDHWSEEAAWGLDSRFFIYSEDEKTPRERVHFLGLNEFSTMAQTRARMRHALGTFAPEVAIYHGYWGLPNLADLDGAGRRILVLHGEYPGSRQALRLRRRWLDGVLCVNPQMVEQVRQWIPELSPGRIGAMVAAVQPPMEPPPHAPLAGRPVVLGYTGRLIREQKRVDLLPALCRELDRLKVPFTLELLGDGPERASLERQFADDSRVTFHGVKTGKDYWSTLAKWDVNLFLTEYEGGPITLLEGMAMGVIPFYPRIHSGFQGHAEQVAAECVYEPGDLPGLAATIGRLAQYAEPEIQKLRDRCREIVEPHSSRGYFTGYSDFVRRIRELPRVSTSAFPRRWLWVDHCPYALLLKLGLARRSILRSIHPGWRELPQGIYSGVIVGEHSSVTRPTAGIQNAAPKKNA